MVALSSIHNGRRNSTQGSFQNTIFSDQTGLFTAENRPKRPNLQHSTMSSDIKKVIDSLNIFSGSNNYSLNELKCKLDDLQNASKELNNNLVTATDKYKDCLGRITNLIYGHRDFPQSSLFRSDLKIIESRVKVLVSNGFSTQQIKLALKDDSCLKKSLVLDDLISNMQEIYNTPIMQEFEQSIAKIITTADIKIRNTLVKNALGQINKMQLDDSKREALTNMVCTATHDANKLTLVQLIMNIQNTKDIETMQKSTAAAMNGIKLLDTQEEHDEKMATILSAVRVFEEKNWTFKNDFIFGSLLSLLDARYHQAFKNIRADVLAQQSPIPGIVLEERSTSPATGTVVEANTSYIGSINGD